MLRLWLTWVVLCSICAAQDGGGDLIIMNQLKGVFRNFPEVARTELVGGWDDYSSMCTWQGVTCTIQGFVQVSGWLPLCSNATGCCWPCEALLWTPGNCSSA